MPCYPSFLVYLLIPLIGICHGHYPIGYQIHSINDLEEWNQLLTKGAIRFKVDLHYHEKGGNCAVKGIESECFLLSHDNPNKEHVSYNTSQELVQYLKNDFQSSRQDKNDTAVISFCFKSAPDMCDETSDAFLSWISLVDELYASLTIDPPDRIVFILDGDAKPVECLVGRWSHWDSVWILGSSPDEAYYSNEV